MRSEGASQKQLVDALNMRPATVSEQTDILIELGYVTSTSIIWIKNFRSRPYGRGQAIR